MSWQRVPLRRIFRIINGGTPTSDEEYWGGDVPWATPVDIGSVNGGYLTVTQRNLSDEGVRTGSRTVPGGSLLLSTRAPIGYVAQVTRKMAFNQGCRGLISVVEVDPRYFRYQILALREKLSSRGAGSTFTELSTDALAAVPLLHPPLDEQRRIADFLDAETAFVDRIQLMRSQQKEQLIQRRWSVFQYALDGVPKNALPLRRLLDAVVDGPFGSAFSSSDYVVDGAAVVRLGNIGFCEYRPADQARIPISLYQEFRKHKVREGDILIAGLGDPRNHAGRACIAPDLGPAIVKGKCFRARVDPTKTSAEFIALLLSSPLGSAVLEGRGSTRSMINLEVVKSAIFPIPRYMDQLIIAKEMSRYWQTALAAIETCERQLALLAERRQALITAAVTGQIDVTAARGVST